MCNCSKGINSKIRRTKTISQQSNTVFSKPYFETKIYTGEDNEVVGESTGINYGYRVTNEPILIHVDDVHRSPLLFSTIEN